MTTRPRPTEHRAPGECPVCGDHLAVTRLGCGSCGTELAGVFAACSFCALDDKQIDILRVFLSSRGNLRELERHLGVSYPTARQRFAEVLIALGLAEPDDPAPAVPTGPATPSPAPTSPAPTGAAPTGAAPPSREEILARVAAGTLSPADAARLLQTTTSG